ncbi:MAG: AEC family transporter [Hyphomicrobiales bacterium]
MTLFTIVAPIFALIAIGRLSSAIGLLEPAALRGLTDFVFFFAMPALLLGSIAEGPPFDILGVAGVYFSACLVIFGLGVGLALILRLPLAHAAMLGLNASYGNTVMMGIPIVAAAFGQEALPPLLAIIALHSAILLPLAGALVEMGIAGRSHPLDILRSTILGALRNPIIVSILAGFLWRGLGLPVPAPLHVFLQMLGAAGPPLALACLGASLPGLTRSAIGAEAAIASVLKLAALPALVFMIGQLAHLSGLPLAVAVLTGGMPTGANAFLLARRAEMLSRISATTVLITTMLSLLTLSALLAFLR